VKMLLLAGYFIRNCESFSSFCPAAGQHLSSVCGRHSFPESVFITSFPVGGLVRSFHYSAFLFFLINKVRKGKYFIFLNK